VLSIHRLTAGDGYKYLLKHVASGDVDRRMATPLTAYYAASGYPIGRWMGSGLAGLGGGSITTGTEVTEPQMAALFGRGEDPLTGRALGRPYRTYKGPSERIAAQIQVLDPSLSPAARQEAIEQIRHTESRQKTKQAVAGFDLTFSPVKSVSALWATADVGVQEQIVAAHHEVLEEVIDMIERHAAFTRTGDDGLAQIDTRGLIATAFDHWDTRSGDPQLHTHVVVANRVQGHDRQWRTLDGRVLFRAAVAMSEIHNVLLADNLSRRLGVNWELRERRTDRNPAFEIDLIPDDLIHEFSSRTEQIESNLAALLEQRGDEIHPPNRREMYVLRQQATLMNRPPKHLARPLAALMAEWRKRADQAIGHEAVETIRQSVDQASERPLAAADLSPQTIEAYGATTMLSLQNKRSTWTRWNLLAEAARQTRLLRIVSTRDRFAVLQAIVQSAEQQSISLTAPDLVSVPITRVDGESVFTIHNGQVFTSPVILGAEARLLDLAADLTGPTIGRSTIKTGRLSDDKVHALRRIATSGQKVEALIGPAGTGKTSLLAALRTSWESVHGQGSIIALAPSSAAATVLADALGTPTENIAKWIHEAVGLGAEERRHRTTQTETAAQLAQQAGRRRRQQRQSAYLAALRAERDRWSFRPNQLVIVDEASMAGTMELATLAREANAAGAKLLLVGDDAQLGAADTGGAFRLVARETDAAQLTDVWRFSHDWEREASLALRHGNKDVIDAYDVHNRLVSGSSESMEDTAYQAWRTDITGRRTSLLIAADNATVTRLNARARLDKLVNGEVEADGVDLHDGNHAGVGDNIITRLNNRRLRINRTTFVQNGDRWTVLRRWNDGSLTVQNDDLQTVTLPAAYVRESVELGYATTAHRAQGATVDTAHLLVTEQLTRALLYVGMTRGRHANRAYVATQPAATEMHEPALEQTMQDVLDAVLEDPGVELSAHEVMRQELDNATRLDRLVPIHEHLTQIAARQRYRPAITTSGLDPADQATLQASPAYGPLIAALRRAEAASLDPTTVLRQAVTQSSLNNANDIAAVLHNRIHRIATRAERRSRHRPHLIAGLVTPSDHITDPAFTAPLRELEAQITQRADWLADRATADNEAWLQHLIRTLAGATPDRLQTCVRELAAYRERYDIRSDDPLGAPPPQTAFAQQRHHARLSGLLSEGLTTTAVTMADQGSASQIDAADHAPGPRTS
jgi:conjugative relaxase-like TrwC/TraI family protein